MAHGVIRTDRMFGTDNRAGLVSVKYMGSGTTATDIDNGNVVKLDGLMTGERELFKGVTPAKNDALDDIAIVATPEVIYCPYKRGLEEFYNEAGKYARAYRPRSGDVFGVTKDALDGAETPAVGDVVELQAGVKLNVAAASTGATQGATVVGAIIAVDVVGRYTYYVIEVD